MNYLQELNKRKSFRQKIIAKYVEMENPIPDQILANVGRIAFLPSHIASASSIDLQFFTAATKLGLIPIWTEYTQDTFSTLNGRKMMYLRPRNVFGEVVEIAKPKDWEGKKLSEIICSGGKSLTDFHHEKWDEVFADKKAIRFDLSSWLQNFGKAESYYYHTMILNTFFGVSFWPNNIPALYREGEKEKFVVEVMNPAREKVFQDFGFYPLEEYFSLAPTFNF